ncbi:MAG TPA: helix-hairpin-helix domain-containing protein [Candidatus Thermoplasmatota archaeon]|nr:helix-hairpin-helix domain-containing protein [Candidatus Thermoplasmatota archaeon]
MVSESKRKRYDIKDIHDFIDSASTKKQQQHYAQSRKTSDTKRKKESPKQTSTKQHATTPKKVTSRSETLAPKVVVRKRESAPKKEEIVFTVVEPEEAKKKEEVITFAPIASPDEDFFFEEQLYEIESVVKEKDFVHKQQTTEPEGAPEFQEDVTPAVSVRPGHGETSDWKLEEEPSRGNKALMHDKRHKQAEPLPEFERVDEDEAVSFSPEEPTMTSEAPVEIEVTRQQGLAEPQPEALTREEKRKEKAREKQTKLERRQQERETKRLIKEQGKKAIRERKQQEKQAQLLKREEETKAYEEQRALQRRFQDEERLEEEEEKKAAAEAWEKQREEQRLLKEREKNLRLEQRALQQRLQEEERLKEGEKKKSVAQAREKQREEHRVLKERDKNQRIEQRALQRKEKQERKQQMKELNREQTPTAPPVSESAQETTTEGDQISSYTPEPVPEEPTPSHDEDRLLDTSEPPFEQEAAHEEPLVPAAPKELAAPDITTPKENRREQKRLWKEQKQKLRMERIALKEKEKQERQQQKKQAILPERAEAETINKADQKRKLAQEKLDRREAKRQEREMKQQQKLRIRQEQEVAHALERNIRQKEKEKQRQHKEEAFQRRQENASLERAPSIKPPASIDLGEAVGQQEDEAEHEMPQEGQDKRKLKVLERKIRKEQEKKEKEERKLTKKKEENEQKRMELHFEEEATKEKQADSDRITIFDGFDTIDQETAKLLYRSGYDSVEKLLRATIDDLKKIGIKKKIAKDILTECLEFIEWNVKDVENPDEKIGGIF